MRLIVAPHAGAWIETDYLGGDIRSMPVAPHAGAWIDESGSGHGKRLIVDEIMLKIMQISGLYCSFKGDGLAKSLNSSIRIAL